MVVTRRSRRLSLIVAAGAIADSPLSWSEPEVIGGAELKSVSCPTTSLCVAVDMEGDVVTSTNPTGGASAEKIKKAGKATITLKPTAKTLEILKSKGAAKVIVEMTFTPAGGTAHTISTTLKLEA